MFNTGAKTISFSDANGKIIIGWNTARDGSGTSYAAYDETVEAAKTSIVRLYAQWAPEGTTLYAKGTASNRNIYLALYANGKIFSGGRRVITRSSNYLPKYTASDGANIYYYSTDPEGKADRYMPGIYADL